MNLVAEDLKYVWHPATQMKDLEQCPPLPIKSARGPYLYTADGREIIDIIGSWWCSLLGHRHPRITAALCAQAQELEHVIFAGCTHEGAVTLAERLAAVAPQGICRFNFADNGSSAVEIALKLAFQYQQQIGQTKRIRFACLSSSYHGETIGALAVGSLDRYARLYEPMLRQSLHVQAPDCLRCPFGLKREHCQAQCLCFAREALAAEGDHLAAFIVEPLLQGAAGMRVYPELYLKGLERLCREHGILLIADEIATGFGRTGAMFACNRAGVKPDLIAISKGLTGGYLPMSVVGCTDEIYQAFYADYHEHKAFLHSHTYAGNPLGCACALAVMDTLAEEKILERMPDQALRLNQLLKQIFLKHPNVAEVRSIGLINAIELVESKAGLKAFDPDLRIGFKIYQEALKRNLLLRPIGEVLYFNPPLNIEFEVLEKAAYLAYDALCAVLPPAD